MLGTNLWLDTISKIYLGTVNNDISDHVSSMEPINRKEYINHVITYDGISGFL